MTKLKEIRVTFSEGSQPRWPLRFLTFSAFDGWAQRRARTELHRYPDTYLKTDVEIETTDGQVLHHRYDITTERWQSLARDVRHSLAFMAGLRCPLHWTEEMYRKHLAECWPQPLRARIAATLNEFADVLA